MIIAYVISESYSISTFNGIRMQAEIWAVELERKGHTVVKVNPWENHKWEEYDIIHIFGPCEFILNFTSGLYKRNKNIVFSPIIDTIESIRKYKIASLWGCKRLRLSSPNYTIRQASPYIKHWLVRSEYEFQYVNKAYSIPQDKISIVPLSFRIPVCEEYPQKESFCLHVSKLTDGRKNVIRLLKAAVKYKFKLVLAGSISSEEDFTPLKKMIDGNDNITYLGRVSDDKLIELYKKAKVFALPSINEGVGMVAVEAASYGCDIVVTEIGGPKEYYNGMAYVVNPYSVDEIGTAVLKAMNTKEFQPQLQSYIQLEYNLHHCVDLLINDYQSLINGF